MTYDPQSVEKVKIYIVNYGKEIAFQNLLFLNYSCQHTINFELYKYSFNAWISWKIYSQTGVLFLLEISKKIS